MDRERGSLCPTGSHPRAGETLGDRPAPIVGVGAPCPRSGGGHLFPRARTRGRRWPSRPGRRAGPARRPGPRLAPLLAVVVTVVGSGTVVLPETAGASVRPGGHGQVPPAVATSAASATSAPLTLVAQTPFVTPAQPVFDVRLRTGTTSPPVADLGLTVAVYGCLSSISAFDQSVTSGSGPSGTKISSTRSPLAVSGLPALDDAGGGFDLAMPVTVGSGSASAPTGGFAIDLTAAAGQCGLYPSGVYPVRLELVDTSTDQALGGITTHLVYADTAPDTQRLRFALVLPVQATLRAAPATTATGLRAHPSSALAPPTAAATDAVTSTVDLVDNPRAPVPLTLDAGPQTVLALDSTGHQSTVSQLAAVAASPSVQVAASPFVPVDAARLVDAGLQTELGLQVAQGTQVLDANVTHPTAAQVADDSPGHLGTWFSDDGLDAGTLGQLQAYGYDQVVLPASAVSSPPTNGSTAEPFPLTSARGTTMTALAANADLSARFTDVPADPVLAAHQLVAELAQMYYEKPNDTTPRGVVGLPPSGWTDDPAFVGALLGALNGSPIVQPVTTASLFAALAPAVGCHGGCKLTSTTGSSGLPVTAIRTERQRINALAFAAPSARDVTVKLSEIVLSGESENLRPGQQAAVLGNASAAVNAQLSQIAVAGDRTITLTSQRGRVPVTIVSAAPYPVRASLTLTSDKLLFANHSTSVTQAITLQPGHTNVIYVTVQARASGSFRVGIVLRDPVSHVVLSSGEVSVRSTATSVVGIVLSLGAVAVLAVWWIRTSRKRRRARRSRAAVEVPIDLPDEPVVAG